MDHNVFKIKKTKCANKTIRMPIPLIERLQKVADINETSFNQVVVQCCEYALKDNDDIKTEDK